MIYLQYGSCLVCLFIDFATSQCFCGCFRLFRSQENENAHKLSLHLYNRFWLGTMALTRAFKTSLLEQIYAALRNSAADFFCSN